MHHANWTHLQAHSKVTVKQQQAHPTLTTANDSCRYFSVLPTTSSYFLARPDGTTPTDLSAVVGQSYQAQPGSSEDKALYQVTPYWVGMSTLCGTLLLTDICLREDVCQDLLLMQHHFPRNTSPTATRTKVRTSNTLQAPCRW